MGERKWEQMNREGCWIFWILQNEMLEIFGCKCVLSFQKREEGHQKQFRDHWGCYSLTGPDYTSQDSMGKGKGKAVSTSLSKDRSTFSPKRATTWALPPPPPPPLECCNMDGAPHRATDPCTALRMTLPPQWAWKAKNWAKKDYSQALGSIGICLARSWTCLEPVTPSFFSSSLFENENGYLYCTIVFKNTYLVWFHEFTAEEEFCLRINSTSHHLFYILFRWDWTGH